MTPMRGAFKSYICFVLLNSKRFKMNNQEITVVYKWTAIPGKADELKAIYRQVEKQMNETEPGALKVDCYFDESTNALIVSDLFKDSAALGQHLGTTAAGHFPALLQIAEPGASVKSVASCNLRSMERFLL